MHSKHLWMWIGLLCSWTWPLSVSAQSNRSEPVDEIRGLLLRFDEPVGRRITDYSGSGHAVSTTGGVTLSRNDKIGGLGSVCFDGTGYLTVQGSPDFYFPGDFTIDFWFKNLSARTKYTQYALSIAGLYPKKNIGFVVADSDYKRAAAVFWNSSGSLNIIDPKPQFAYIDNPEWHHFAFVRSKNVLMAFIDGEVLSADYNYPDPLGDPEEPIIIGAMSSFGYHPWVGCIDEVRIINGRALWSSNFNPQFYLPPPINAFR